MAEGAVSTCQPSSAGPSTPHSGRGLSFCWAAVMATTTATAAWTSHTASSALSDSQNRHPRYRRGSSRSVHAGSQPGWPRTRGPHPAPSSQTHPLNCLHMMHSGPFNNTSNRDGPGLSEGSKSISVTNARSSNFHLRMIPHLYLKTFKMTRLRGNPCSPVCSV